MSQRISLFFALRLLFVKGHATVAIIETNLMEINMDFRLDILLNSNLLLVNYSARIM
jgi:hypothetical protein